MKYSIIIPAYNVEKYISECIESVLAVRPESCEIIIIDDGSTDDTLKIAKDYQEDFRDVKICSISNSGPMKARLKGISLSKGKWIVFLDGDDKLDKQFFDIVEKMLSGINSTDMIVTNMARFDEEGYYGSEFNWDELGAKQDKWKIPPYFGGRVISRQLLSKNYVVPKHKYFYEDPGFMGQVMTHIDKVYFANEPLYHYRVRRGSTSLSDDPDKLYDMLLSLEGAYRYIRINNLWEANKECFEKYVIVNLMLNNMAKLAVINPNDKRLFKMYGYMEKRFKGYRENKYLKDMGPRNKLYFALLSRRAFKVVCGIGRLKKTVKLILTKLDMDEIIKRYQKEAVR